MESKKLHKYDVLANELSAMHKYKARTIPYVLTWDGIVTKFHKSYSKAIGLSSKIEAYIQFLVLKKTLESISFDYRRAGDTTPTVEPRVTSTQDLGIGGPQTVEVGEAKEATE